MITTIREAARILGPNRETLTRWADDENMPVVSRSKDLIEVDTTAVVAWMIDRATAKERQKHVGASPPDGEMTMKDRLMEKQIHAQTLKIAMAAKAVVLRETILMAWRQANGLHRQTVMSLPERIVRIVGGSVSRAKMEEIREETWKVCSAAETSWATEINQAMVAAAGKALEDYEGAVDLDVSA